MISLLSLNVEARKHLDRWIPFVKNVSPDIVLLQEITVSDIPKVEDALGHRCWFTPMEVIESPSPLLAGGSSTTAGIAIVSKYALIENSSHYYYKDSSEPSADPKDPSKSPRALQVARFIAGGRKFAIGTTHFTWSAEGENSPLQWATFRDLLSTTNRYNDILISGDFNVPATTPLFESFKQHFKSWIPDSCTSTLDPELFRKPWIELRIDHLLSTSHYQCSNVQLITGLSDHKGILTEVESFIEADLVEKSPSSLTA